MTMRPFLLAVAIAAATVTTLGETSAQTSTNPLLHAPAPAAPVPQPGMAVLSSDGKSVGTVESIDGTQDGRITAVNVATSRFLGFGTRLFAIPEGKFSMQGTVVRVAFTADEVSRLPPQDR
jgi:hypothetical protein